MNDENEYLNDWMDERENDDDIDYENMTLTTLQAGDCVIRAVEPPPMNCLTIHNAQSEMIVNIDPEGNVEFGENYTPEEAAEVFWTSLGMNSPMQMRKEIDELKTKLFNQLEDAAQSDKGRVPQIEPLPFNESNSNMLEDIEYFRKRIQDAMSINHPTEKLEKQLTALESAWDINEQSKQAIRDGGWEENTPISFAESIVGVQPMTEPQGKIFKIKKRYSDKEAFEKAMEIVE